MVRRVVFALMAVPAFVQAFEMRDAPPAVPVWRDATPGAAYLGPDVLWRCREGLVFHLLDDEGAGFALDIDVRDMNCYQQGARPVLIWVTAPSGLTVVNTVLEDDGEVAGDAVHCDGISDVYLDFRYREWHRRNSPGGRPPGKRRSPFLSDPSAIPARHMRVAVPAAGRGLYRLTFIASWDHWVAVTPSRPLVAGVHPGPGPLYVHGDRLEEAYLYVPSYVEDLGVTVSEEIEPFNWRLSVEDLNGRRLGGTEPRTFLSYAILTGLRGDEVYRLRVDGTTTGAYLHAQGAPFVVCPDVTSARRIHGGVDVDARGRITFHEYQRVLLKWAEQLTPGDLAVAATVREPELKIPGRRKATLGQVLRLLDCQDLDPASDRFGRFDVSALPDQGLSFGFWRQPVDTLAAVAGWADSRNPVYGHPALIRRILLCRVMENLCRQGPFFWYAHSEGPKTFKVEPTKLWTVPMRSNWYPMHDAKHALTLGSIREAARWSLPSACFEAWRTSLRAWAIARTVMHQGECSNQWAAGIRHIRDVWKATRDPVTLSVLDRQVTRGVLDRQVTRFTTPGNLGRGNPDPTPFDAKSGIAHGGRAADIGLIGGGVAADGVGHDNEYCLESTLHLASVWESTRAESIVTWLNEYYVLKTHLTMPKSGDWPGNSFSGTCSPTDANFRTCCYTHKSPLGSMRPLVRYGDIWGNQKNAEHPWPCLEDGSFTRVIDNRYFFIKTPAYYSIAYGGPSRSDYANWCAAEVLDGSARLLGYTGMHYTGLQRKATKPGGISAIWVPGCGPTWLCANHNVMFTNTVWGRVLKPVCEKWEEGQVDPYLVCGAFAHAAVQWDAPSRTMVKVQEMTHVPLRVTRRIQWHDQAITVEVTTEALAAIELRELFECIPYFADRRAVRLFDAGLRCTGELPIPPASTSTRDTAEKNVHSSELSGENPALPPVSFRAVDIASPAGPGAAVIFGEQSEFRQTQPVRYRRVASPVAGFSLPLPTTWAQGQTHVLRYAIAPHAEALDEDALRAMAGRWVP